MSAVLELAGRGPATTCEITTATAHRPTVTRHVWHHVQPQEAGGQTVDGNLAQLCDNCHYACHRVMWCLAKNLPVPKVHRNIAKLAQRGYDACVAAGTVEKIPNEG